MTAIHYHVGHNVPGYLPMDDEPPFPYESFADAKAALIEDIKFAEGCEDDEDAAENFCAAAEVVNLWSGPDSIVIDDRPGSPHSLGVAYWIIECESWECEPEEDYEDETAARRFDDQRAREKETR